MLFRMGDFKLNMVKQRYDTSDEQQRVEFITTLFECCRI